MKEKYPFVSVVIPAYNEALMLPSCLESLKDQDYKGKYEIIVVDNNSTDLTYKIAKVYGVKVISEKKQGVVHARQSGFRKAMGEIIFSTDADTIVPPNWISRIISEFQKDKDIIAIGGSCDLIEVNTPFKMVSKLLMMPILALNKIISYPGNFIGWNFAVKKQSFKIAGGFDIKFRPDEAGEDVDLSNRLKKIGKIKIILSIKVKTSARRFTGIVKTFKYVFGNYFYQKIKKRSLPGIFEVIRQKPFESYDNINYVPFFLIIITICVSALILLIGAIPSFNIWSTSSIKTNDKVLALTFDNSLNSTDTQQILKVLENNNIHATFFVTGEEATKNPQIIKYIYESGNIIGNQSLSNDPKIMLKTSKSITKNIESAENIISNVINKKPKFFRPPYGYRSIWGALSLDKSGYETITWDVSTNYFSKNDDSKKIAIYVIKNTKQGGIIDINIDGQESIKATEEIIGLLKADGYKFVTLDELLQKTAYF